MPRPRRNIRPSAPPTLMGGARDGTGTGAAVNFARRRPVRVRVHPPRSLSSLARLAKTITIDEGTILAGPALRHREAPEAYVPSDRRAALAAGRDLPDRARGAALFADISGFTALADALAAELGGHRASEALTAHLNRVFHALIAELDEFGGSVVYFSGDAITCWFDSDDGLHAVAAAFAMQRALADEGVIETGAGTVALGMKVAVAVGRARRFLVGDPAIQLLDALAGRVIDRLATAEQLAGRGEVLVDEAALAALGQRADPGEARRDPETLEVFTVLQGLRVPVAPAPLGEAMRPLAPTEVKPW